MNVSRLLLGALLVGATSAPAQPTPAAASPDSPPAPFSLTRIPPAYPTPYAPATAEEIKAVLDRVLGYLEEASPVHVVDRDTQQPVADLDHLPPHPVFARTDFLLTSYEWGVTYAGMLHAAEATGDLRYRERTVPILPKKKKSH